MHVTSQIEIARPRTDVFDYLSHGEFLAEYATDFDWVKRTGGTVPGPDALYSYRMTRGVEGTFRHIIFEPPTRLAWQGPPAKAGPGTMAPAGMWQLEEIDDGTRVVLTMSPTPGGLLRLMTPMIAASIRKTLPGALQRLKQRLELTPHHGLDRGERR